MVSLSRARKPGWVFVSKANQYSLYKGSSRIYCLLSNFTILTLLLSLLRDTATHFNEQEFLQSCFILKYSLSSYIPTSSSGPHHLFVATKMSHRKTPTHSGIPIFFETSQLVLPQEIDSSITATRLQALPLHIQMVLLERLANQRLRNARSPEQQEAQRGLLDVGLTTGCLGCVQGHRESFMGLKGKASPKN